MELTVLKKEDPRVKIFRGRELGKVYETNRCGKCTIIEYRKSCDITVKFHNPDCTVKCSLFDLQKGEVLNPLYPLVQGEGYRGIREPLIKDAYLYNIWAVMLQRGFCKLTKEKFPTYRDATVCKEWLDFQVFAEWCYNQKGCKSVDKLGNKFQLDKDILVKDNKTYSPDTCCFVPKYINTLLTKSKRGRGSPVGVYPNRNGTFTTKLLTFNKRVYLGTFTTSDEAFSVYKKFKELHIKDTANIWKDRIDLKTYESLINWEVLITD